VAFREEFDAPLDVSPWGPGTRWIAHTPWSGDFGDAAFADPVSGFPFRTKGGVLRIEARKDSAVNLSRPWRSGLLSSNDPKGHGFSLQYGYFEISAKLPGAKGVWPAFWLSTSSDRTDPNSAADGLIEIDVLEFYGFAEAYFAALHVWKPEPRHDGKIVNLPNRDASKGFHTYGALVTPEWIRFYRDRRETWRTRTPSEHKRPLMILLNLALGGGWPIDGVPNPSYMLVDYVRAYAKP
jgi:beta-glucanase (GH16 family)